MNARLKSKPSRARRCGRTAAVAASSAAFALGSVCYAVFLVAFSAVLAASGGAYCVFSRFVLGRSGRGERTGRK